MGNKISFKLVLDKVTELEVKDKLGEDFFNSYLNTEERKKEVCLTPSYTYELYQDAIRVSSFLEDRIKEYQEILKDLQEVKDYFRCRQNTNELDVSEAIKLLPHQIKNSNSFGDLTDNQMLFKSLRDMRDKYKSVQGFLDMSNTLYKETYKKYYSENYWNVVFWCVTGGLLEGDVVKHGKELLFVDLIQLKVNTLNFVRVRSLENPNYFFNETAPHAELQLFEKKNYKHKYIDQAVKELGITGPDSIFIDLN